MATPEEVETDGQEFDCATCAMRQALDSLWPENRAAWDLYRRTMTRFAFDCRAVGGFILRYVEPLDRDEAFDLLDRLTLIYDELVPIGSTPREI